MGPSLAFYGFAIAALVGAAGIVHPIRWLGIRRRGVAALVLLVALAGASRVLGRTILASYVVEPASALDEFAPIYEFSDANVIPVRAPASRVYQSLFEVTAAEVPLFRTLAWIRRGGARGPESALNPPDDVPLFEVATRTSFIRLAAVPGRELVMGVVVMAPRNVRVAALPTPEGFKAIREPGFAKAAVNFSVEPQGPTSCLLRTETRVHATDPLSRDAFARYWTVIAPGSRVMRLMWLRAIKVRAEGSPR